jgi:hypothetical protein
MNVIPETRGYTSINHLPDERDSRNEGLYINQSFTWWTWFQKRGAIHQSIIYLMNVIPETRGYTSINHLPDERDSRNKGLYINQSFTWWTWFQKRGAIHQSIIYLMNVIPETRGYTSINHLPAERDSRNEGLYINQSFTWWTWFQKRVVNT